MPRPLRECQALEREEERQFAAFQAELDATAPEDTVRLEMRAWQNWRAQKRMAEVAARLAKAHSG